MDVKKIALLVGALLVAVVTAVMAKNMFAGASAPEDVVQECIEYLQVRYGATIEEEWVREENVHFPLPKSLRELLPVASATEGQD